MHRSRSSLLVILAATAACSTRDSSSDSIVLSKDTALVARFEMRNAPRPALPAACGSIDSAQPTAANKARADALTRSAYDAELVGNVSQARLLLRQAAELDGTDKVAAYHLGRTSEALGDRTGAVTAYCRYLVLTPTAAESVDARGRVERLSQSQPPMAGTISLAASTGRRSRISAARRATRLRRAVDPRAVASADRANDASNGPVTLSSEGEGRNGDGVVATTEPAPTVQPAPATRASRRAPSRAQTAGYGALAGAIMGAAAGRSVKSAAIGAAAGGILGAVVSDGSSSTAGTH